MNAKIKCPICDTTYCSHEDEGRYCCPICNWIYTGREDQIQKYEKEPRNRMSLEKAKFMVSRGLNVSGIPLPKYMNASKQILQIRGKTEKELVASLKSLMQEKPIKEKERVLQHLKKGVVVAVAAGHARDLLTGEELSGEYLAYSDGEFSWTSAEIYYFEKYNVKLEDDFIAHALKSRNG